METSLFVVLVFVLCIFVGLLLLMYASKDFVDPKNTARVALPEDLMRATFAAGCFRCAGTVFKETPGVVDVVVGYAGGEEDFPGYDKVLSGTTAHRLVVQISYDPARVSYDSLLDVFRSIIDPTDDEGQYEDRGHAYTSAIFYHTMQQFEAAEISFEALDSSGVFPLHLVTEIIPYTKFFIAEDEHQDFFRKQMNLERFLQE